MFQLAKIHFFCELHKISAIQIIITFKYGRKITFFCVIICEYQPKYVILRFN